MSDWEAIKKDFESGLSLRTLSAKHDIGKSTIHEHAIAGQWQRTNVGQLPDIGQTPVAPANSTVALANSMIGQLATIAKVPLDLKEHNLFAQALSQYNKIAVTGVDVASTPALDWSIFTEAELAIIQPIFSAAEERKRIAEGESTIPQLRKQG
jgi:hypothetical protein